MSKNVYGVLMICRTINLPDLSSHHSTETALANTPLSFSPTNSLDSLPSFLPYLNVILQVKFFSYSVLLKTIYINQKVLVYAAVMNNPHIT